MPIDIEEFDTAPEGDLRAGGPTNGERVLAFLSANDDRAFTPSEIREATDIPRGSVGVVLSRLEEEGLVRHRGEYWAIGDTDAVARFLSTSSTARAVSDRLGTEEPEEWGPGADGGSEAGSRTSDEGE